jgi:hypothetical protein
MAASAVHDYQEMRNCLNYLGGKLLKVKAIGCQLSAIDQKTPITVPDLWPRADSQ